MRVTPPGGKYIVHIDMYWQGSDFYTSLDRDFTSYIDSTVYTGGAYLSNLFEKGAYLSNFARGLFEQEVGLISAIILKMGLISVITYGKP